MNVVACANIILCIMQRKNCSLSILYVLNGVVLLRCTLVSPNIIQQMLGFYLDIIIFMWLQKY